MVESPDWSYSRSIIFHNPNFHCQRRNNRVLFFIGTLNDSSEFFDELAILLESEISCNW